MPKPKLTLDLDALKVESFAPVALLDDQEFAGSGAQACFTGRTCPSGGAVCCA